MFHMSPPLETFGTNLELGMKWTGRQIWYSVSSSFHHSARPSAELSCTTWDGKASKQEATLVVRVFGYRSFSTLRSHREPFLWTPLEYL